MMSRANGRESKARTARGARLLALGACAASLAAAPEARAQAPADFFRQNCASCHTIGGGRLTGPDLKDVTRRRDRAWLERFLQNPKAVIDAGDPYALELQREARGVVMPTVPGMTPERARDLLGLVEEHSALPRSPFAGLGITDRPFTPADVAFGRSLFAGARPLAGGGPACASCHGLATVAGLGGGRLGPDLTRVYERLGNRKAVGAWLAAPATPTMQSVLRGRALRPEEILGLLAAIEEAAGRGLPPDAGPGPAFFLLGLGAAVASRGLLGWGFHHRFTAVRRPLVERRERGEA
jgi:mono/diheme cytochrome c family protein